MVTSKRIKGKNVQPYTQEHKNKTLALEIPLHTHETPKYIGGLRSYLHHTISMCNPTNIDKVLVQVTHLEATR